MTTPDSDPLFNFSGLTGSDGLMPVVPDAIPPSSPAAESLAVASDLPFDPVGACSSQPLLPPECPPVELAVEPAGTSSELPCSPCAPHRQLILPTDRKNPSMTLYRMLDAQGQKVIQVYYGVELLEVVADDVSDPTFRCMVARLYNARLKLKTLVEVFSLDPKTIRSWGEALISRDPKRMSTMFFGPDAARKCTKQIEAFVRMRLPELKALGVRDYRLKLQTEIELIFHTRLSGETLRILMGGLKLAAELTAATEAEAEAAALASSLVDAVPAACPGPVEETPDMFDDAPAPVSASTEKSTETTAETTAETTVSADPAEPATELPAGPEEFPSEAPEQPLPLLVEDTISALDLGEPASASPLFFAQTWPIGSNPTPFFLA